MTEVNIHHAKTHLSRLLLRVAAGEEIVIAKAGKPLAKLVPIRALQKDRVPGGAAGQVHISADFDAPLSDELLRDFEHSKLEP